MNGFVDRADRALVELSVHAAADSESRSVSAWVDTAFTGELVVPRPIIDELGLVQSSVVSAGLADGKSVSLRTFSCFIVWHDKLRAVEVIESHGQTALLGIGLLRECKVEIDYPKRTVTIS